MAQMRGVHNRLPDEEKKRRGTFRADKTEAIYSARIAETVIRGPWGAGALDRIPEPSLPLNEIGRAKYDELTLALFDQRKPTGPTRDLAEAAAVSFSQIHRALAEGREVRTSTMAQYTKTLSQLRIADEAPVIAGTERHNKFSHCGFANRPRSAG
jgi:hypothetical protein